MKELFFQYFINKYDLFNFAVEDNDEFIRIIPEIVFYEKGKWKNNIRIDIIKINIVDIPFNLRTIIDMMRDKKGEIGIRIKIFKEIIDDKIIIKTKLKLNGIIGSLINKAINLKVKIEMINNTEVKLIYDLKSILQTELLNHIENKIENYYIKKVDEYIKTNVVKN